MAAISAIGWIQAFLPESYETTIPACAACYAQNFWVEVECVSANGFSALVIDLRLHEISGNPLTWSEANQLPATGACWTLSSDPEHSCFWLSTRRVVFQLPYPFMLVLWIWISFGDGSGLRVSDLLSIMSTVIVAIVMARYDFILPLFMTTLVMTLLAFMGIIVMGVERLAFRAA